MGAHIDPKSKGPYLKEIEAIIIVRTRAIKCALFSNKMVLSNDHVYLLKDLL